MKTASTEYRESMASPIRNNSYVKILFENINASASADGVWKSNGEESFSDTSTLDYEYEYGSLYATLEHNYWTLNGEYLIFPDDYEIPPNGYVSSYISDKNGEFTTKPTLTRRFSSPHNLIGMRFIFDSRTGEVPVSITLTMYAGKTIVFEETIHPNSDMTVIQTNAKRVSRIVLTFNQMLPYRRARLEAVGYGIEKIYVNGDITEVKQSHDVDPISRRLPQEKMTFSVIDYGHSYDPENPEGVYEFIDANAPLSVQYGYELDDGTVEWLKADKYRLDGKPTVESDIATFSATGLIGSMTGTYYKDKLGTKTLYDMAESVLSDAGLSPTRTGQNPWVIDSSLKEMITTSVLPISSHANCLQIIAHATRCKLYTDDDNIVHISPFSVDELSEASSQVLNFSNSLNSGPAITKIEPLKAVTVAKYSYTAANEISEIYRDVTTETTVHVEFSGLAQDVSVSVTGGAIFSSNVYGRAADITMSIGTKEIVITGRTVQESSVVLSYTVSDEGETDVEENPLITSDEMAYALAAHVTKYLRLRNTYDVEYRGNPEYETGDMIGLQTRYSEMVQSMILADEITFNGSLKGSLKLKGLIGVDDADQIPDHSEPVEYNYHQLFTSDTTWTAPAGVTSLYIILIGGGQAGGHGAKGSAARESLFNAGTFYGESGADGATGYGGNVWYGTIEIDDQEQFSVHIGSGGIASTEDNSGAVNGEASTFGEFSSDSGYVYNPAFTDPADGSIYARIGATVPRVNTGDGGAGGAGGDGGIITTAISEGDKWPHTVSYTSPKAGYPGTDGASGCVIVYWNKEET